MNIVAPAGNIDRLKAAVNSGADEIYLGLKGYGARRNATNFSLEELKEAIEYAHLRGSRVFLTLNTIMLDSEIKVLYNKVKYLYENGLDAIIIQDLGLCKYIKDNFPEIELHASTQIKVANHFEINMLKNFGFKRVVLPRELSYEEIKNIRENTDMELEVFVSGAICISFSGNCYLSSFIGGRSGNRGMCAQPCRKLYKDSENQRGYFLSPKDQLLGYDEIKKLKDIGIDSIKIEGRMKDEYYVYETVKYYKNLIKDNHYIEKTSRLFNRGYARGYFYGRDKNLINKNYSYNLGEKLAEVKNGKINLQTDLNIADGITYLDKNYEKLGGNYVNKIILAKNRINVKSAKKNDEIILNLPKGTKYIYKNYDKILNDEIKKELKKSNKNIGVGVFFRAKLNENPIIKYYISSSNKNINSIVENEYVVCNSEKKPVRVEFIKEKISEIGDTNFILKKIEVDLDDNIFIPSSVIKDMKRTAIKKLEEKYLESFKRELHQDVKNINIEKDTNKATYLSVVYSNEKQLKLIEKLKNKYNIKNIYEKTFDIAKENELSKHNINSNLASNFYQVLFNKNKENVILNWNMNITNSYSIKVLEDIKNLSGFIISPEISFNRIKNLTKTRLKKCLLIYSKLKGMTIDYNISKKDVDIISNEQGDNFKLIKNKFATELYIEKPLNIINDLNKLSDLNIDEFVIEFNDENEEEIMRILNQTISRKGEYRPYNYERGVM